MQDRRELVVDLTALNRAISEILSKNDRTLSGNFDAADGENGIFLHLDYAEVLKSNLYYYQEEALEILKLLVIDKYYFEDKFFNKLIINLPPGAGKTRIFLELISWWKEFNTVLITAPTISLLRQLEFNTKTHMDERGCDVDYLVVAGDPSASEEEIEDEEDEEILNKMLRAGEATTDVVEIQRKLITHENPLIVFSTYKSLSKVSTVAKRSGVELDLWVADEGHRACDKPACEVFEINPLPVKCSAYFTATVKDKQSNSEKDLDYPMSNMEHFGPVAYRKSIKELASEGFILPPYPLIQTWNSDYSRELYHLLSRSMMNTDDDVVNECALFISGLIEVYKRTGKVKNITFVQSIDVAEWYKRNFNLFNKIMCKVFDSDINIKPFIISQKIKGFDRIRLIHDYENSENAILFNYQVVKEGIDIPDCNSVTLMRKMDSTGLYQAMGRPCRKDFNDPNKDVGYVIFPVNIDTKKKGEHIERMRQATNYFIEEGYGDMVIGRERGLVSGSGKNPNPGPRPEDFLSTATSFKELSELLKNVDNNGEILPEYHMRKNLSEKDNQNTDNLEDFFDLAMNVN